MVKKIWFGLAALVIGGGVYFAWTTHREPAFPVLANTNNADHIEADKDSDANSSPQTSPVAVAKSAAKTLSPRQRYEQSRDLFALVQDLRAAADSGDIQAKTIIADALYECIAVTQVPGSGYIGALDAEQKHPELKNYVEGLIAIDKQRCGRFVKQDIGGPSKVIALYTIAADNGSAKAMAMKLTYVDIDHMPDAKLAADIRQITESRDPDAIGALSNLMGLRAENRQSVFGDISGHETQQYAWLLAACDMGMNCGSDSRLLRQYCLNAGVCGFRSIDQVISSSYLTPADYHTAVAQSHEIVNSLYNHH